MTIVTKQTTIHNQNITGELIYNDGKKAFFDKFRIIILISMVDIICQLCFLLFAIFSGEDNIIRNEYLDCFLFIDIVSRYFFSIKIIKNNYFTHHKFSFILNVIALIL